MGRQKAAQALQETFVNQFGASSRETVEAEVSGWLGRNTKKLEKKDLDAIEAKIIQQLRMRRTTSSSGFPSPAASTKKAHMLRAASAPSSQFSMPEASKTCVVSPMPLSPSSTMGSAQGFRVTQKILTPGGKSLEIRPKRPLLKPVDAFDLFAQYNTSQLQREQAEAKAKAREKSKVFREGLDIQMEEIRAVVEKEKEEKKKDREKVLAAAAAQEEAGKAELEKERKLVELRKATSLELLDKIARRREMNAATEATRNEAFTKFLERQKQEKIQEKLAEKAEKDKRNVAALAYHKEACAETLRQKQAYKDQEARHAAEWTKVAEAPSSNDLKGGPSWRVKESQKRVDNLVNTMGKKLVEDIRRREQAELDYTNKAFEKYEKKRLDDYWQEEEDFHQKVLLEKRIRDGQVAEYGVEARLERAANLKQSQIWQTESDQYHAAEAAKMAKARKDRSAVDVHLFDQMAETDLVHKSDLGVTEAFRQRELAYNRPLLDNLQKEKFNLDKTSPLLLQASMSSSRGFKK
eukprot:TRINITY_DN16476_c0_g1_i1.p1 TRINITY_DN16476_c0_g1~~TRINITY_DN16476_c0_g1_i1.p1  ORF type:complete len:522 (+),score=147.23 TRINITY_DN16476_c0_g1_i1:77-1642(+)